MHNQKISFIIPVYNEADNLEWHYKIISEYIHKNKFKSEIVYINDGSGDDSLSIIKHLSKLDSNVKFINFTRNFGKESATSAGLKYCSGEAAIIIDADGQHPIEIVSDFIKKWKSGAKVVVGVRKSNSKEGMIKKYGSKLFYKILSNISDRNSVPGSTDFRLIDRKVIEQFNLLTERSRITRGLIDWLGFSSDYIYFDAPSRHAGKAGYGYNKLIKLALNAFISNSTRPLQFTGFIGSTVMIVSMLIFIVLSLNQYLFNDALNLKTTGTAYLAIFLSFLVGLVLICQWMLALYIESIHGEAQNRPLYVVDDKNID